MRSIIRKWFLLLPLAWFAAGQAFFLRWIPDDAFISFRYAHNFAAGRGLVFNEGEKVEGFSNLLWTLYLAAGSKAGMDIVVLAVTTSILSATISLLMTLVLFRIVMKRYNGARIQGNWQLLAAFTLTSAGFFPMFFYATSGLETTTYLLFLLLGAFLHIQAVDAKRPAALVLSSYAFLIAALLRPEGLIFLLLNTMFIIPGRKHIRPGQILAAMIPLVLFAGVACAKHAYYGAFVPNTYFAKPGASWQYTEPLIAGFFYLLRFFAKSAFLTLLPFALLLPAEKKKIHIWMYLWSIVAAQLVFIVYVGPDVLRFDRFAVPFYPFYLALALMGVMEVIHGARESYKKLAYRTAFACLVLVLSFNFAQAFTARGKTCLHDWMHGGTHKSIGLSLEGTLPGGSTVVANEIGALAYYSNYQVIDMLGLTDKTISTIRFNSYAKFGVGSSPESIGKVSNYILSKSPQCIIIPSYTRDIGGPGENSRKAMHPLWHGIFIHPLFKQNYKKELTIKVNDSKYIHIFIRHGAPFATFSELVNSESSCGSIVRPPPSKM